MRIVEQKNSFDNFCFLKLFQPSDALSPQRFYEYFIATIFISLKENTRKFQNMWKQKFDRPENFANQKAGRSKTG